MTRIVLAIAVVAAALALGLSCSSDEPEARHGAPRAVAEQPPRKPYTVLLIMDEFPSDSLLDRQGRIDPVRYPSFAALAADSTWFRNAYSVYDSTTKAVPLILDGLRPRPHTSPDRSDHRRSLYDMLARRGYRIVDSEEATALCPPRLCRGGRTERPAIIPNLMGGRPSASTAGCARSAPVAPRPGSSTCCCRTAPTSSCPRAPRRVGPRAICFPA